MIEVVLVVAGGGDHDVGRTLDAGPFEHRELGAVAVAGPVAELLVQQRVAILALLDEHGLVIQLEQGARHVLAHLAAADDDDEAHVSAPSRAKAASSSIALVVGETTSKPRFA